MLLQFFAGLREARVPVCLREYLTLLQAMESDLAHPAVRRAEYDVEAGYNLLFCATSRGADVLHLRATRPLQWSAGRRGWAGLAGGRTAQARGGGRFRRRGHPPGRRLRGRCR